MNRAGPSQLWLAVRLPDLPLEALGMDIATAQSLSACEVLPRDPAKEQQTLLQLSEQLYQFSPYIERYCSTHSAQSGLLLEVSRCLNLFGGLQAMTARIADNLAQTHHRVEYGIAHSAMAAWLLSFSDQHLHSEQRSEDFIAQLAPLPLTLLSDYPKAVELLQRTGFRTMGDLTRQISGKKISSLKKRLGSSFAALLTDIYATDAQIARRIHIPQQWFKQQIQFDYPVTNIEQLKPALEKLLLQLSAYLRRHQQQCQCIEWSLSGFQQNKTTFQVRSDRPQQHGALLYDLTLIQLEQQPLPFDVDSLHLECRHSTALQLRSELLHFDQDSRLSAGQEEQERLVARIKARLGEAAVYKVSYQDSHLPELSNRILLLAEKALQDLPDIHRRALRPTWLLANPQPVERRGERLYWHGYLTLCAGPERVTGQWWKKGVARDYYLATRHDHLPVWIFRNLYSRQWFVHGVFA